MENEMYATSDKMADENETCKYCDRLVNSPNFAYHFCNGRKLFKGSRPTKRALDAAICTCESKGGEYLSGDVWRCSFCHLRRQ